MRPGGAVAAALALAVAVPAAQASGALAPEYAGIGASEALAAALREMDAVLLAGESLPPGFLADLAPLRPAERLLAIAYARRAGLLTGPALSLRELFATEDRP